MSLHDVSGILLIFVFILALTIVGVVGGIISIATYEQIEETTMECTIVHKDIDNGYLITVTDGNGFSKTIRVTVDLYTKYQAGDLVTVVIGGYSDCFSEYLRYAIKE